MGIILLQEWRKDRDIQCSIHKYQSRTIVVTYDTMMETVCRGANKLEGVAPQLYTTSHTQTSFDWTFPYHWTLRSTIWFQRWLSRKRKMTLYCSVNRWLYVHKLMVPNSLGYHAWVDICSWSLQSISMSASLYASWSFNISVSIKR